MLGLWLIACCKLAPTLVRQMWRHSDVIDYNEYLISTLSESFLGYIHCNFCLNPHIIHGDMKENVSGCFFLNTVYNAWTERSLDQISQLYIGGRLGIRTIYIPYLYWRRMFRAAVGMAFQSPYPSHTHRNPHWNPHRNPHTHGTRSKYFIT